MRLLQLAMKKERWDLAAHTIVLATARHLKDGGKLNEKRRKSRKAQSPG
jgi:hypothetical protein